MLRLTSSARLAGRFAITSSLTLVGSSCEQDSLRNSRRREEGCVAELERIRECEEGKGGFAQLHLVYAVKKRGES